LVIDFSTIGVVKEQPTLVLCNADGKAIQTLGYAKGLKANVCYNEMSTITFDIPAYVDGVKTPHYDDIIGMRIIDMINWGRFILMNPSIKNDGVKEIKSCKAYSLEYELTYKKIFLEEATYNFWNPLSPDDTILGMIIAELPSWTIGTVDEDLINKYRTLSSDNANTYNFIKSTLQKLYGCIFDFDSYTRTINVRSTANEAVSKPVYLSMDNLVKEIQIDEDTESIVTALDVCGGEDVDIRSVNPMGTNMIYNLDYFMNTTQFDQSVIDKWNSWKQSFEANQLTYYNISIERMLKTSAILTEQVVLSDLKNIKLASLESERAVYVEYLAQHANKNSSDYSDFQSKLKDVNRRIASVEDEISAQETVVNRLKDAEAELTDNLITIQKSVAFDKFFTHDELIILDRYFKEESIEESSFVVSEVDSYSDSDISNAISNVRVSFANTKFTRVVTDNGKVMYTVDGGTLTITSDAVTLSAKVVSACFERNDDETMVLSTFLNKGTIGEASFPSGCISITGTGSPISTSGNTGISFTVTKGNMYFTRNTTDYEKHSVSWDLFEYGKQTLNSLAYPSYSFSVSSANFMTIDEFVGFMTQLELGQKIYLNTDSSVLQPIFIGADIDFENLSSLSLQFSDKYSSSDSSFKLVELLDQSISMGKTVDANKMSYSAFVDSGASTKVKEFMESALDVAKNAILSSSGQGVSWDETGLHLRKYIDSNNPNAGYEDEQIWMINNSIVFTDDNWQTAKMAIGKIIDENIAKYPETADKVFNENKTYYYMDEDEQYQVWEGTEDDWADRPLLYEKDITAYGIVAPYIVGTILAGQNLVITTEDGSFRVDSSGVHIDSMKFFITHDDSSYDTTLGDELQKLADAENKTAKDLADAIEQINDVNTKVENAVTTHYRDSIPDKTREGDLWYVTGDCSGWVKRNIVMGDTIRSVEFDETQHPDCDIAENVLMLDTDNANAATLFSTADGRLMSQIDTVYDGENWSGLGFGWASGGIGMNYPSVVLISTSNPFYSSIIGECYESYKAGKLYRYNGSSWQEIVDADAVEAIEKANDAQATADQKIVTFYQRYEPYQPTIGDLWYNTAEAKTETRHIEVGDSLAGVTITIDTSRGIPSVSDYNELIKASGGFICREPSLLNKTSPATLELVLSGDVMLTEILCDGENCNTTTTISTHFGIVESVDKADPFYDLITATFTSNYEPKKLYRYDGTSWILVEDGDIEKVKSDIDKLDKTLGEYITEEGYLTASKLQGAISTKLSTMQNGAGNVLFDDDGIWLLNAATKESSTSAIWMNEQGILFGTGTKGYIDVDEDDDNAWSWTTAIGHDGVIADAMATKILSAFTINGGSINIGNGNFVVNTKGELTAKAGVFSGVVQASDFKDSSGKSMLTGNKFDADYLSLYGIEIKNKSTNKVTFAVDENGAVTINGGVTLGAGSKIEWANIDESGSSAYSKAQQAINDADDAYWYADDAYDYADSAYSRANSARTLAQNIANGVYSGGTFIDGKKIYSPEIYANEFNVLPRSTSDNEGSFNLYAYYGNTLYHFLEISYYEGTAPYLHFDSPAGAYTYWDFNLTRFTGTLDFENATIQNLNVTAKFG